MDTGSTATSRYDQGIGTEQCCSTALQWMEKHYPDLNLCTYELSTENSEERSSCLPFGSTKLSNLKDTFAIFNNKRQPIWSIDSIEIVQGDGSFVYVVLGVCPPSSGDVHYPWTELDNAHNLIPIWKFSADSNNFSPFFSIAHQSGTVWNARWVKNSRSVGVISEIAACMGDGSVQMFSVPNIENIPLEGCVKALSPIYVAKLPEVKLHCIDWDNRDPNIKFLAGGSDGLVTYWDRSTKACIEYQRPKKTFMNSSAISFKQAGGWAAILKVLWSPADENVFVTAGQDQIVRLWDFRITEAPLRAYRIDGIAGLNVVYSMCWNPQNSEKLLFTGDNNSVYVIDILSGVISSIVLHDAVDFPVWDILAVDMEISGETLVFSCCSSGGLQVSPFSDRKGKYLRPSCELFRLKCDTAIAANISVQRQLSVNVRKPKGGSRFYPQRCLALHSISFSTIQNSKYSLVLTGGQAGILLATMLPVDEVEIMLRQNKAKAPKNKGFPRNSQKRRHETETSESETGTGESVEELDVRVSKPKSSFDKVRRSSRKSKHFSKTYKECSSEE